MSITEAIIIAVITTIGSIIGGGIMVLVSWRKAPSEIDKNEADSGHAEANAAETWARTSQMAAQLQQDLIVERNARIALETKFNLVVSQLTGRINRLEAQVKSLGAEPVQ